MIWAKDLAPVVIVSGQFHCAPSKAALALECARDSQNTVPLQQAAVREAAYPYSRERTRDIAAEYRFQYPGLLSILEIPRKGPDLQPR